MIAGYTKGQGRRSGRFGALVLGVWRGAASSPTSATAAPASPTATSTSCSSGCGRWSRTRVAVLRSVPKMPKVRKGDVVWVRPELVCEVEFVEWTHDGRLRAPSFQGLRDDKPPREVHREEPLTAEIRKGQPRAQALQPRQGLLAGRGDHEGRPARLLPRGRRRCCFPTSATGRSRSSATPTGSTGGHFFQKDAPRHMPDWIPTREFEVSTREPPRRRRTDRRAARQRRARAALDGEHGLHRPEHVVLARRPAGAARLRALRPRPGCRRRLRRGRPGRAARQGGARRARAGRLPEDERQRRDARARPGRAAPRLRRDPRVRRDRRRHARADAPRAGHDRVDEGEAPRRADRREPERRGEDDRVGLLGAAAGRARPSRRRCAGTRCARGSTRSRSRWTPCSAGSSGTATCSRACSPLDSAWEPP